MRDFKSLPGKAVTLAAVFAALPLVVTAQNAEDRGLEIAEEADRRDNGFVSQVASLRMTLRNRHGQESVREIRNRTLEVAAWPVQQLLRHGVVSDLGRRHAALEL